MPANESYANVGIGMQCVHLKARGFVLRGRQIVIAFFWYFFFFKFRVGVGKTGLSGLSPSPLVPEQLGVGVGGGLQVL